MNCPDRIPLILAYHYFGNPPAHCGMPGLYVTPEMFTRHLDHLLARGVHFCTFAELARGECPRKSVIITLDDGADSVYRLAYPLLQERNLPATVFPVVGDIGGRSVIWPHQHHTAPIDLLTTDEIREMAVHGIEFGSHLLHHVRTKTLADEVLRNELRESRRILCELTGQVVETVAYPFGSVDRRVARIAVDEGYRFGLTVWPGGSNPRDLLRLPRWSVRRRYDFWLADVIDRIGIR